MFVVVVVKLGVWPSDGSGLLESLADIVIHNAPWRCLHGLAWAIVNGLIHYIPVNRVIADRCHSLIDVIKHVIFEFRAVSLVNNELRVVRSRSSPDKIVGSYLLSIIFGKFDFEFAS